MRTKLIAKLHIILSQQGVDKELFLSDNFGKSSSKELTDGELINAINALEGKQTKHNGYARADEVIRKLRSEILTLLTRSPTAANARQRGLGIPNDWSVLNPWIERRCRGKRMYNMNIDELKSLRGQILWMRSKGWYYGCKEEEVIEETQKSHRRDYMNEFLVMHGVPSGRMPVS